MVDTRLVSPSGWLHRQAAEVQHEGQGGAKLAPRNKPKHNPNANLSDMTATHTQLFDQTKGKVSYFRLHRIHPAKTHNKRGCQGGHYAPLLHRKKRALSCLAHSQTLPESNLLVSSPCSPPENSQWSRHMSTTTRGFTMACRARAPPPRLEESSGGATSVGGSTFQVTCCRKRMMESTAWLS